MKPTRVQFTAELRNGDYIHAICVVQGYGVGVCAVSCFDRVHAQESHCDQDEPKELISMNV